MRQRDTPGIRLNSERVAGETLHQIAQKAFTECPIEYGGHGVALTHKMFSIFIAAR